MYQIHRFQNRISRLEEKTFSELGFRERENLQEWIASNPEVLGEELLVIQKEFSGFAETKERLDLLALDKQGNLVIIENKLDDSGRDVTWQSLKYASYCANLSKEDIKDIYQEYLLKTTKESAEANLREFFEGKEFDEMVLNQGTKQRIILVAANFRKEVTSTVLWLMSYNLRIQCFKVTPYQKGEDLFLDVNQILPTKEAQEYTIRMADKSQDEISVENAVTERSKSYRTFWTEFLTFISGKTSLYQTNGPSNDPWIVGKLGMGGVGLHLVVSRQYARVEIYISRGDKQKNKEIFDALYAQKDTVEAQIEHLVWERMDDKVTSRIKVEMSGVSVDNKEDWQKMFQFLLVEAEKMYGVFRPLLDELS